MFLTLDEVAEDGRDFDLVLPLPDLRSEDGEPLVEDAVRVKGRAEPGSNGIDLRARVAGRLHLACSRCLEPFDLELDAPFRLTLVGEAVEYGGDEFEMAASDADVFYAEGGRADLSTIAREQILLHLPLKPICESDCLGLCPSCGANRNRIECACRRADLDPRLAPLLRLRKGKIDDS